MPRWVPRAALVFWAVFAGLLATYWLLIQLRGLLVTLLVSLILSFALEPAVNWMQVRGVRRGLGVLVSLSTLLVAMAVFFFVMGRLVADQVSLLVDEAPQYIEDGQRLLQDNFNVTIETEELIAEFSDGGRLGDVGTSLAGNVYGVGVTLVGLLFQLLTVLLFTFYLVADGPRLRRAICSTLPPERQREVLRVWELGIDKTGGYIYSRALLALFSALFHWLVFTLIGVPFPAALALWVGVVSQFLPVVGTYLAGFLPLLIAVIDRPISAVWVMVAIIVYQQIENYLLAPRITAQTMQLHAAVAFAAVIAGGSILGPIGTLLALPIAATLQAFVSTYIQRHEVVSSELTG